MTDFFTHMSDFIGNRLTRHAYIQDTDHYLGLKDKTL